MQNNLSDLNNHLFAQLERLSDESLKPEALEAEVKRSTSIIGISREVVSNANLQLKAIELDAEHRGIIKTANMKTLLPSQQ